MTAHPAADDAERPTNRPIVVFGCSALKRSYRDLLRGFAVEHAKHVVEKGVQAYFVYRACSAVNLLVPVIALRPTWLRVFCRSER